jgi:hypothetical protein
MFIPAILDASLVTIIHGWQSDAPAGLIDRAASGLMPWQAGYETVRAVAAAALDRWTTERLGLEDRT